MLLVLGIVCGLFSVRPLRSGSRCGSFRGELTPAEEEVTRAKEPKAEEAVSPSIPASPPPAPLLVLSARAGFGLADKADPLIWSRRLGAGWYLDWSVHPRPGLLAPQHWQMVRMTPDCLLPDRETIRQIAQAFPGLVWVLGNEPDVIWQDNLTPETYARRYHDLYYLIKGLDPTASVAIAGISQATPLRLAYLDRVLRGYERLYGEHLPVDWWTVHGFVLREERNSWGVGIPPGFNVQRGMLYEIIDHDRLLLFQQHIIAFRTWMAQRGYRDKPLALTEFGILMPEEYGFPPEQVADYLETTFTWLLDAQDPQIGYPADDNRLVQRWAWFSLADPLYASSDLAILEQDRLTATGERFRQFVLVRHPLQNPGFNLLTAPDGSAIIPP